MTISLEIEHTESEGTLIHGTTREDRDTIAVLKSLSWRWSRQLGGWYIPRSRDVPPKWRLIEGTADALRQAGREVAVSIESGVRDQVQVEAERIERQSNRVAGLEAAVARKAVAEDMADAKAREYARKYLYDQPILVGHHSEKRHRRDIERSNRADRAAVEAYRATQRAQAKADAAQHTTSHRYSPGVVARRIETLAADLRRAQRNRDGYRRTLCARNAGTKEAATHSPTSGAARAELDDTVERLEAQIRYWTDVRHAQEEAGQKLYTRGDLRHGHLVQICGQWREVVRVNPKSVSVKTGYTWTDTVKYDAIASAYNPATARYVSPGSVTQ